MKKFINHIVDDSGDYICGENKNSKTALKNHLPHLNEDDLYCWINDRIDCEECKNNSGDISLMRDVQNECNSNNSANKAIQIRHELKLSPTECGKLFIGGKNPYRAWKKLEDSGNWNAGTEKMLNMILILITAKENKVRNCHGALDLVLKMLEPIDKFE